MTTLLKCPICGGTERSLLPSSVCEECGCDMKPDASDARRVLFDKSQPKEARVAAMDVLQPKPAEAREPVGDAELRQQRDAAEQRAATLSRMLEERTFPSVEVTDAMVERGLRWYWPHDMKYADNQRDFMRRFLEAALAQPRDTPRDSGDAKCVHCGEATMHMGTVCYTCSHPPAMQSPTGEPSNG